MILVLDNAPYHHCHVQGGINVKGASKRQLIDWAYELEMAHFTVTRDGNDVSFESWEYEKKGGINGPYKDELALGVLREAKKSCPERLLDELEAEFDKHGFELIFTAPYTPKFNPIEAVWAYTKNDVAYQYKPKRSLELTACDIYTRWYGGTGRGDKKPKSGLTPIIAQKMVSHCQDEMNKWIEQHGDSTGISAYRA